MKTDCETIKHFFESIIFAHHEKAYVYAIKEGTNVKSYSFRLSNLDDAIEWIDHANISEKRNIYFSLNLHDCPTKPKKQHITELVAFHVDVDMPPAIASGTINERKKWISETEEKFDDPASLIYSGNGVQAIWSLCVPHVVTVDNLPILEQHNAQFAAKYNGDHCHNIDRILRVPGTVNWPNKKKTMAGYEPRQTYFSEGSKLLNENEEQELLGFLPEPKEKTEQRSKPVSGRTNYLNETYRKNYKRRSLDDLVDHVEELDDAANYDTGDSSADGMRFIVACVRAFMRIRKCEAVELNKDTLKNICEIVHNCDMPFVAHYDRNGPEKIGYDLEQAIQYVHENLPAYNEAKRQRETRKQFAEYANKQTDANSIDNAERFAAILVALNRDFTKSQLPNCDNTNNGEPARLQPVTFMNVCRALEMAGVTVAWDDMRSLVSYYFNDPQLRKHVSHLHNSYDSEEHKQETYGNVVMSFLFEVGLRNEAMTRHHIESWALRNRYHPWTDYCESEPWDGLDHVSEIANCLESKHPLRNVYMWVLFKSIAATIKSHDHFVRTGAGQQISSNIILVGDQGLGKSKFLNSLVPPEFRSQGSTLRLGSPSEKDHIPACLSGILCVLNEIGQTMRYSDHETLKDFLAFDRDNFRLPYGRSAITKPRMTVFCGTSNDLDLQDQTGSRRFLAMDVSDIDSDRLSDIDIQQAHAQAYEAVKNGANWWLESDDDDVRGEINEAYRVVTEEEQKLADVLDAHNTDTVNYVNTTELFKIIDVAYSHKRNKIVSQLMESRGYVFKTSANLGGERYRRVWVKEDDPAK